MISENNMSVSQLQALQNEGAFYISSERRPEEFFSTSGVLYVQARKEKKDCISVRAVLKNDKHVKDYSRIFVKLYSVKGTSFLISKNPRFVSEKPKILSDINSHTQLFFPISPVHRDNTEKKQKLSEARYYLVLIGIDAENKEHMVAASSDFTIKSKERKSQHMRTIIKPRKQNTKVIPNHVPRVDLSKAE